jgi:hypothetical protein
MKINTEKIAALIKEFTNMNNHILHQELICSKKIFNEYQIYIYIYIYIYISFIYECDIHISQADIQ